MILLAKPHRDANWTEWMPIGEPLLPTDMPGSVSSEPPEGDRELFIYGWMENEHGVWRSRAGADIDSGTSRTVITKGLELLSDLSEPFEQRIFQPTYGIVEIRITLDKG